MTPTAPPRHHPCPTHDRPTCRFPRLDPAAALLAVLDCLHYGAARWFPSAPARGKARLLVAFEIVGMNRPAFGQPLPERHDAQSRTRKSLAARLPPTNTANALQRSDTSLKPLPPTRRAMAGVMLALILALYAAVLSPALHHFLHGADADSHSASHESDCVVLAFTHGGVDPIPFPEPIIRPLFAEVISPRLLHAPAVGLSQRWARPPSCGPPRS